MTASRAGEHATFQAPPEPNPWPADESVLLEAFRDGDPRAARNLVDATYGRIYDVLARLSGNADLAADQL